MILAREGETLARLLADAGTMVAFGTLLFRAGIGAVPRRLHLVALLAAFAGLAWWLVAQAAAFGAGPLEVLAETWFGRVLAAQGLLLAGAAIATGWPAVLLAGVALAAGAGHGHGVAMGDAPGLVASHALHLLAAGAWLGSLPALACAVAAGDHAVVPRFSRVATAAVVLLAASALYQGFILGGGLPGLVGTPYGAVLGAKAALFALLLGFAAWHRFRLTPALPASARRLAIGIVAETGIGLLAVGAAVLLDAFPPGMHDQPWWPFAWRPDGAVLDDPDLRMEVLGAAGWCAAALALAVAGLRWKSAWLGVPVALWLGIPSLGLLLVPAYPTSYWRAPEDPTPGSIARGGVIYAEHCVSCHGAEGRGDGAAARGLPIPPADLTAEHLWYHSDGELFWWLSAGIPTLDGAVAMPGFADRLTEAERWAVIDFIRARNPFRPAHSAPRHHH